MNFLVIGIGSMGRRRVRLLKEFFHIEKICGVELNKDRANQAGKELDIVVFNTIDDAMQTGCFDAAFVCTSPLTHFKIIDACLDKGLSIFSEINLVQDGYQEIIRKAAKNNLRLYLSSTMLFRKELIYITKKVSALEQPLSYVYHVGQYLPDWHPWENYKNYFVGDTRTNGCREIYAIELPWLINAFGEITDLKVVSSRNSTLAIDYKDNYLVLLTHQNGNTGCFAVDVVSRKAVRNLEVFGENLYIQWNGTPDSLMEYDIQTKIEQKITTYDIVKKNKAYSANIIENAYIDEISEFIDCLSNVRIPAYSFKKDLQVLSLLDQIGC
jgi:predicted dehydrogenase